MESQVFQSTAGGRNTGASGWLRGAILEVRGTNGALWSRPWHAHTRATGHGLFELRLKAADGIARVFYCTVVDRQIVMLHQFVKKTEKTPPKELDIARRRMKEVKNG